ncbi:ribosome silencing factor [Mycoplasmatota bacterium zrk1]
MKMLKDVINIIDDVRGKEIVCFDMDGVSPYYRYVVICSGNSDRQTNAIMNRLRDYYIEKKLSVRVEGKESGRWVLIDLGDIIVNVFIEEERAYFQLEKLWLDVPRVDVESLITKNV